MGGSKGGGAPGSDPAEIMRNNALYNRLDQFTPEGSVTYSGPYRNQMTVERSPEEQAMHDQQRGLRSSSMGMMLDELTGGMLGGARSEIEGLGDYLPGMEYDLGLDTLPGMPGVGSFENERVATEEAMMGRAMSLINPQFDRRAEAEGNMLSNRGVPEISELGSEFSGRRADDYDTATRNAAWDSVMAGSQEQSRLFGQGMARRGQTLAERLQQIGQQRGARGQMFNELTGLGGQSFNRLASVLGLTPGGGPGGALAGFAGPGQVDTTGAYGTAQNAWNLNQQYDPWNQGIQLAGSLGAAGITAASDVRVKKDIDHISANEILKALDDVEVYRWRYKNEPQSNAQHIGPMAQGFNGVFETPGGDNTIDLISVCGVLMASVKALSKKVEELENASK